MSPSLEPSAHSTLAEPLGDNGERRRNRIAVDVSTATKRRGPERTRDPHAHFGVATVPEANGHRSLTPGQLTISRRVEGDSVTLVVAGEIDLDSAPMLEHELRDAERSVPRRVVLDLAKLDFLDSTGIHLLIDAQLRADAEGHQLVLTRVPGHAERIFTLTGLMPRLTVE